MQLELMTRITCFPYSVRLDRPQQDAILRGDDLQVSSHNSAYSRFVTLIGALAPRNDKTSEDSLDALMAIRDDQVANKTAHAEPHEPVRDCRATTERSAPTTPLTTTALADAELPRYTMALKEYGDSSGPMPCYDFSCITLDPPLFRAKVTIGNLSFEESASSKKQAKHLASRRACQSLGVSI